MTSGISEGRSISLQLCGGADTQRWVFSHNNDDTNLILDTQGMCLDGRSRNGDAGLARSVQKCEYKDAWRFTYTSLGLIMDVRNNRWLQVPGAVGNAAVSLADCDASKQNQQWVVTH